jgi:putative serine protease PepD
MTPDPDPDDERPGADEPLPPEDRLWRHPSEIAAGIDPPAAWFLPPPPARSPTGRKLVLAGALAGACMAGALVAVSAMWVTRPTKVVERSVPVTSVRAATTAAFTFTALPTERIARRLGPSLPSIEVLRDGQWTSGTGVWMDRDGTVVTAAPLIEGTEAIIVTGRDGVGREALIAGADTVTGIAVLRTEKTSGTPIDAHAATARAGEQVVIVGAGGTEAGEPASHATTAVGVIRVTSMRSTVAGHAFHDTIQLDRSVPADATGGVIVDAAGRLIGFTLGTATDRLLGVATPAAHSLQSIDDLRRFGKVDRAWLGVQAIDLDPGAATMLEVPGGARLTAISPGSPAEAAGLAVGDVVTDIGRTPVDDASDLVLALRDLDPGDHVWVTIQRAGKRDEVRVTLAG